MDIFNKHKSQIIAASITLLINGLFILMLSIEPSENFLSFNSKLDSDKDLAIQFQLLEEIPLPPTEIEKNQSENIKENQPKETIKNLENLEESSKNAEETIQPANKDSELLAEIKKTIQDIKNTLPDDSLPKQEIKPENIKVTQQNVINNNRNYYEERKFYYDNYRVIRNLKLLYPYVLRTREIVQRLDIQLTNMTDKQERRRLIKKTEKELFNQYEKDIRNMSYSQGKLLLKLLARETNESAYGLIKTYKGGIPATFWYTVGLIFQEDLKARYDSIGEDALLEKIVQKYKQGNFNSQQ
ncbi:MAG TPA: DUF4294 domain-containing protein [Ignavibacteria bacterium]